MPQHKRPDIQAIQQRAETGRAQIMADVRAISIPAELQGFIDQYEAAGWGREHFLWQWAWRLLKATDPGFTLSSVPDAARRDAALVKFSYLMAVTMTDDAADERQDAALVDALTATLHRREAPTSNAAEHEASIKLFQDLLAFADNLLADFPKKKLPRATLQFDLEQVWNAFSHAVFVNTYPQAITFREALNYGGHNMMMTVFADVDLCFSDRLSEREMPKMRDAFSAAQDMARIGNWVTTWRREVPVGDVTSGVVAHLLNHTDLTADTLKAAIDQKDLDPVYQLIEVSGAERELLDFWTKRREDLRALAPFISTFDVTHYVDGLDSIMLHHFASIGAK